MLKPPLSVLEAVAYGDGAQLMSAVEACPDDVDVREAESSLTPLMLASRCADAPAKLFVLLRRKADVNLVSKEGCTALLIAAEAGVTPAVEQLLTYGCDPHMADADGCTPLYHAAFNGHAESAKLLLQHRADPNVITDPGANGDDDFTPLHRACLHGHKEVVQARRRLRSRGEERCRVSARTRARPRSLLPQVLIDNGADIPLQKADGYHALLFACLMGHLHSARVLIYANTRTATTVNLANHKGHTPLMAASKNGHPAVVRLLLQARLISTYLR